MADKDLSKTELLEEVKRLRKELSQRKCRDHGGHSESSGHRRICNGLLKMSPDPIVVIQDNIFKRVSTSFYRVFGYTKKEVEKGLDVFKLAPEKYHKQLKADMKSRLEGDSSLRTYEIELTTRNGDRKKFKAISEIVDYSNGPALLVMMRDVSEYQETLDELAISQETSESLLNATNDMAGLFGIDGTIIALNQASASVIGKPIKKLIGTCIYDYFPPEFKDEREAMLAKLRKSNKTLVVEEQFGDKIFLTRIYPILNDRKEIYRVAVYNADITDQAKAAGLNRAVLDNSLQGMILIKDEKVIFVNKAVIEITSYSEKEILSLNFKDIIANMIHPDYREKMLDRHYRRIRGEKVPSFYEYKSLKKNGEEFWCEISVAEIDYLNGKAYLCAILDITRRKEAEEALEKHRMELEEEIRQKELFEEKLRQTTKRYELLFETTKIGIVIAAHKDLKFQYVNPAVSKMFGYTREEFFKLSIPDIHPEEFHSYHKKVFLSLKEQQGDFLENVACLKKDGSIFYADISAASAVVDGELCNLGFFIDVTDREKSRERVRQAEERLRIVTNNIKDAIFAKDAQSKYTFVNPAAARMIGLPADQIIGKTPEEIYPGDELEMVRTFDDLNFRGIDVDEIVEFNIGDKTMMLHTIQVPIYDTDGKIIGISGVVRDVTERKQVENALRLSEERYRHLMETSPDAIAVVSRDGKIVMTNKMTATICGYDKIDELLGRSISEMLADEDRERALKEFREIFDSGGFKNIIYKLVRKDGSTFLAELSTSLIRSDLGEVPSVLSILRDVTLREKAESALRESEEHFRLLAEQSPNMIFINRGGRIIYTNRRCQELMGYTPDEFYSPEFNFIQLIDPDYRETIQQNFRQHSQGHEVAPTEYALVTKDGRRIEALITTKLIKIGGENAILGIITDITALKKTQEKLLESEENFKALGENANDCILVSYQPDQHMFVNEITTKITGYSQDELKEINLDDLIIRSDEAGLADDFRNWLHDVGVPTRFEATLHKRDGENIPVEITVAVTFWHRRRAVLTFIRDITQQKDIETELRKASEDLESERVALRSKNLALEEVLSQIGREKDAIEQKIAAKVEKAVIPLVNRLKLQVGDNYRKQVELIENEIKDLTDQQSDQFTQLYSRLTPRELEICQMIKSGFLSKEIAETLNVSILTIHKHREVIRKKLGIQNKSINLSSYLQSISLRIIDT